MAISFVRAVPLQTPSAGTTNSVAIDGTSSDFLVAAVYDGTSDGTVTSMTYNGVNLVKVANVGVSSENRVTLWVLKAPASGSNNLTLNRSPSGSMRYSGAMYLGVNQANSADASGVNDFSGQTGSVLASMITVQDNDWLIISKTDDTTSPDTSLNNTQRGGGAAFQDWTVYDSNAAKTPPGSFTIGFNYPSSNTGRFAAIAISPPVAAASAAPNPIPLRSLLGVGR